MFEIVGTLVVLFITWYLGALYGWKAHLRHVNRTVDSTLNRIEEELSKTHIRIKIEKHLDVLYVYDAQTNAFMAQGKSRHELEQSLQKKYPGKRFAAEPADILLMGAE
jgi:hypothetical protein